MPPIIFLYWNWLQGLIEKRSKLQGALLCVVPAMASIFIAMWLPAMLYVFVVSAVALLWSWPLMYFYMMYWKDRV